MTNWPDKPLIRIIRGTEYEEPIDGSLAVREDPGGKYLLVSGPRAKNTVDPVCTRTDSIDEWEEVTAVPTAHLKAFKEAWKGFGMYDPDDSQRVTDAITTILSRLPADKPSPLDTVVKYAKRDDRGSKVDVDRYVARLLRSMPSDTEHPEYLDLLRIAKEAVQHLRWCGLLDPWAEIADEARELKLPKTEDGRFTLLVKRIGVFLVHRDDDTATDIGAHALAWAAQIIE
jgi:hypothetical protein